MTPMSTQQGTPPRLPTPEQQRVLDEGQEIQTCAAYRTLYPKLWQVAQAIQQMEGWKPGTRAFRNNNPGNLRGSALAVRIEDNFAVFSSYAAGLHALLRDLHLKCLGKTTTGLGPSSTIVDLIRVYAPPHENDTAGYAGYVSQSSGLPAVTSLSEVLRG